MINDETDWKTSDINVDSLWLIQKRDSSGKHENNYHGNFVPQGKTGLPKYARSKYCSSSTVEYLHILEK